METFFDDLMNSIIEYYDQAIAILPRLAIALLGFIFFLWIARFASRGFTKRIGSRMDDPLLVQFLANVVRITIVVIGCLIALKIIGLGGVATSIMAGAGVGAFVIGFAFKDIGENFLAGIMMAFKRPFRLNDTVELSGITGKVVSLNLRDTQLKTFDGKDVFIPNGAVVKNPVVNYTIDGFIRSDFIISIDYENNIPEVIKLIQDTLAKIEVLQLEGRSTNVAVDGLGASTIDIRIFYWMDTFNPKMAGSLLKNLIFDRVLNTLTAAGITLSSNVMELKNYKSESLQFTTKSDGN